MPPRGGMQSQIDLALNPDWGNPATNVTRVNLKNLQDYSKAFNFLQDNDIITMDDLTEKVKEIRGNYNSVTKDIKKKEDRIKVLDEHLKNYEMYKKNKAVYQKYCAIKSKKEKDKFYNSHSSEIIIYESGKKYLLEVMNGNKTIPINAWKKEHKKLTNEKELLYLEYYPLKKEVKSIEIIKRDIEMIVNEDKKSPKLSRGMER